MSKIDSTLTAERLRELLHYDPDTGSFTWKVKVSHRCVIGSEAGTLQKRGYRTIGIAGKRYQAHRLAWLYVHGEWPAGEVDHWNGAHADNWIKNLRDVPPRVNKQNIRAANKDNSSGFLGVSRNGKRWAAQLDNGGRKVYIGTYDSPQEAHEAYVLAKRKIHPGCTL
jgi:hypothetical protein